MNPTLLKYGIIGLGLIAAGFYIDHRARAEVHEDYRVAHLEQVAQAFEEEKARSAERTRIDRENFELLVYYQKSADVALASRDRMRKSLDAFGVSCDSSSVPGCKAARDIGELLGACVERYRQLGKEASDNYARAKKAEAEHEVNVTKN